MLNNPMQNKTPEERKAIAAKSHATKKMRREAIEKERSYAIVYRDGLGEKIRALELRLASLEREEIMTSVSAAITGKTLLNEDEISASALPWERASGVYFLLNGNNVVYVGQAVHVYSRIAMHTDKKFDRYAFIQCHIDALDKLESLYIHFLQPPLNGNLKNGVKNAPIMLDDLLVTK